MECGRISKYVKSMSSEESSEWKGRRVGFNHIQPFIQVRGLRMLTDDPSLSLYCSLIPCHVMVSSFSWKTYSRLRILPLVWVWYVGCVVSLIWPCEMNRPIKQPDCTPRRPSLLLLRWPLSSWSQQMKEMREGRKGEKGIVWEEEGGVQVCQVPRPMQTFCVDTLSQLQWNWIRDVKLSLYIRNMVTRVPAVLGIPGG